MLIGREKELSLLERLYRSERFEFLILYGRRRVGKTRLLQGFSRAHRTIFFSAQEKNEALNLLDFSAAVRNSLGYQAELKFDRWDTAFSFLSDQAGNDRLVLIIDEFPYIAAEDPSVKSILQHTIDLQWSHKNIFLILCGSWVSFMENKVLGADSPLYGRSTAQYEMKPFDYLDSAGFFPDWSCEDKLTAYGLLGGVPAYLRAFSASQSIEKNICDHILSESGFLKNEPQNLLKMELREPAVYNSIFEAIASGCSRLNDIALHIHEAQSKCGRYVATLQGMRLIEKKIPCGEKESSRKTLYRISDPFFMFWYRFIFRNKSYFELLGEEDAAREIVGSLPEHMGEVFERVCTQYLVRRAKNRTLPFVPAHLGRWWGNDPKQKRENDIDILALDQSGEKAIFCEYKFRNQLFDVREWHDLQLASGILTQPKERHYILFSKSGFTPALREIAAGTGAELITPDDLFAVSEKH